jgi:hypothetical protein
MIALKKLQKIPKNVIKLDQDDKNVLLDKYGCEKGHIHFFIDDSDVFVWAVTECLFVLNSENFILQPGKYQLEQ